MELKVNRLQLNIKMYVLSSGLKNDIKMVKISIQAATHEQVNPIDLLNDAIVMDENGIERFWSSDHYYHGGIVVAWVLPRGHELGLFYLKQII